MNGTTPVLKVLPWSSDQGDYVEINESDFDSEKHKLYQPEAGQPDAFATFTIDEFKAVLDEANVTYAPDADRATLLALVKDLE